MIFRSERRILRFEPFVSDYRISISEGICVDFHGGKQLRRGLEVRKISLSPRRPPNHVTRPSPRQTSTNRHTFSLCLPPPLLCRPVHLPPIHTTPTGHLNHKHSPSRRRALIALHIGQTSNAKTRRDAVPRSGDHVACSSAGLPQANNNNATTNATPLTTATATTGTGGGEPTMNFRAARGVFPGKDVAVGHVSEGKGRREGEVAPRRLPRRREGIG